MNLECKEGKFISHRTGEAASKVLEEDTDLRCFQGQTEGDYMQIQLALLVDSQQGGTINLYFLLLATYPEISSKNMYSVTLFHSQAIHKTIGYIMDRLVD